MHDFLDIHDSSLFRHGEELCGDQVRLVQAGDRTIAILSDGLGSGVKACILATLTSQIIATMLGAEAPLDEVLSTVIGTLPMCKVREIAYATFTVVEVKQPTLEVRVINFDNPPILYLKAGHPAKLQHRVEKILDRDVIISEGRLERGDFLAALSDGVLHAGLGGAMNFGWGRDNVLKFTEQTMLHTTGSARAIVTKVLNEVNRLYHDEPGDDATILGVYVRARKSLMVFTGPPLKEEDDHAACDRLFAFAGRRVVCGGTTTNIVGDYLGKTIEADISTMRRDLPPVGYVKDVDLLTEGILTMARTLEIMREAKGDVTRLPEDKNGAVLLATELLEADYIEFLVGQSISEYYQNPLLPRNISIRVSLVKEVVEFLREVRKEVAVDYI